MEGSACTPHEFGPAKHGSWVAVGTQEVGAAAGTHPTSVGRSTKAELLLLLLPWLLVAVRSRRWKRPAREQKRKTNWSSGSRQEHLCNRLQKAMEHRTTLLLEANWKALRALRMSLDLPSIGVGLQEKNTKRTCRRSDLSQPTKVWIYGRPGSWSRDRSGRRFGWRPVLHLLGWRTDFSILLQAHCINVTAGRLQRKSTMCSRTCPLIDDNEKSTAWDPVSFRSKSSPSPQRPAPRRGRYGCCRDS